MNIVGYVRKYGGDTFARRPPTEVDSLILSELVYLNFTGLVGGLRRRACGPTLGYLAEHYEDRLISETLLPESNRELLRAVRRSERYRDVTVNFFSEVNDEAKEVRFAAATFFLRKDLNYVAFRGTDITLLGWKEDFNMAFRRRIPSQRLAARYLESAAKASPRARLCVGGHSKGGNLALFAAVHAPAEVRARTDAVYDHDGPGFFERIFEKPEFREISARFFKTVPQDSFIGILLHHTDEYKVVKSRSFSLGQHNPFAWKVESATAFAELPATTERSRRADRTLYFWVESMDSATRKKFVEALFAVFGGSGAERVTDFKRDILAKIRGMRRAYRALDAESRRLIRSGGKKLIRIWIRMIRGKTEDAMRVAAEEKED